MRWEWGLENWRDVTVILGEGVGQDCGKRGLPYIRTAKYTRTAKITASFHCVFTLAMCQPEFKITLNGL